jgi:hypothetical protein
MKKSTLARALCVALSMCGISSAQTYNEDSRIEITENPGVFRFTWKSQVGRTYFVMTSDDQLTVWSYLPEILPGTGDRLGYEFTNTAQRFFFRLRYTDQRTTNAQTADFDGDGVSNLSELQAGLDPFLADTDADGLGDMEEYLLGIAPLRLADSDGDGTPDATDAYPADPTRQTYAGTFAIQLVAPSTSTLQP